MATLKLNNQTVGADANMLLLSSVPVVLELEPDTSGGDFAEGTVSVDTLEGIDPTEEYYIEINGGKITSSTDYSKATGTVFYISGSDTVSERMKVATTLVSALRSLATVSSSYDVHLGVADGQVVETVNIKARNAGAASNIEFSTNLQEFWDFEIIGVDDEGMRGSRVSVDIYGSDYITTLSKTFTDSMRFDLSPALTFIGEEEVASLTMNVYSVATDGSMNFNSQTTAKAVQGYRVADSSPYIDITTGNMFLLRHMASIDYTADGYLPVCVYTKAAGYGTKTVTIKYLTGGGTVLYTQTQSIAVNSEFTLLHVNANNATYFRQADSIQVEIPGLQALTFKVVKPLNAHCTNHRVYWRNCYGGVSFFDFVGEFTEQRDAESETYIVSNLDYYSNVQVQRELSYTRAVEKKATMESHLIEEDAIKTLYDMQLSKHVWTEVDGVVYRILADGVEVSKVDDNAYRAQVTFEYSRGENN